MRYSFRQKFATFLGPVYQGMTLRQWLNILRDRELAIDWRCKHHILPTTMKSISNSLLAPIEQKKFSGPVQSVTITNPIFILGHWRSGTTLLHNLLAQDHRYAFPNLYQVLNPLTFLLSEETLITRLFSLIMPRQRLFDPMPFHLKIPHEDEFIFWHTSGLSSCMFWNFPRSGTRFDKYLSLRDVDDQELEIWKKDFIHFLKKVTFKYKKPLILKSPQHTARVRYLLELFPTAKFIHIYREPYRVFQSTEKLNRFVLGIASFQNYRFEDVQERILRQYREMYACYWDDRDRMAPGQLSEVQFEVLESNPLAEIERIYRELDLADFEEVRERMTSYIQTLTSYQKNRFPPIEDEMKGIVYQHWQDGFKRWSYAR